MRSTRESTPLLATASLSIERVDNPSRKVPGGLGKGEDKSYEGRTSEYARPNKMMDEVKRYLQRFPPGGPIACPAPNVQGSRTGSAGGYDFQESHCNRAQDLFTCVGSPSIPLLSYHSLKLYRISDSPLLHRSRRRNLENKSNDRLDIVLRIMQLETMDCFRTTNRLRDRRELSSLCHELSNPNHPI